MAVHLLNILPPISFSNETPQYRFLIRHPTCNQLHVFGFLCFPRLYTSHKLQPRSTPCIFLEYPTHHRGFRFFDLSTRHMIITHHVTFDEFIFPYGSVTPTEPPSNDFLSDLDIFPILHQVLHPSHSYSPTPTTPSSPTLTLFPPSSRPSSPFQVSLILPLQLITCTLDPGVGLSNPLIDLIYTPPPSHLSRGPIYRL